MATFLEMMFTYESSSMLHASVSGAVLSILGAAPLPPPPLGLDEATAAAWVAETTEAARLTATSGRREPFQRHLFEDCRLTERILEAIAVNEDAERGPEEVTPAMAAVVAAVGGGAAPSEVQGTEVGKEGESRETTVTSPPNDAGEMPGGVKVDQDAAAAAGVGEGGANAVPGGEAAACASDDEESRPARRGRRLGHMGHVLLLSRAIVDAQNKEPREGLVEEAGASSGREGGEGGGEGEGSVNGGAGEGVKVGEGGEEENEGEWGGVAAMGKEGPAARRSFVAGLVARRECAEQWQVCLVYESVLC